MSDLRDWLIATLKVDFGSDKEITSKWHGGVFQKWTGMSNKDLTDRWEWDGGYTTCTSFLTNVHGRITASGYAGSPTFLPSQMDQHTGWHSLAEYFDTDQSPQGGDFFLKWVCSYLNHLLWSTLHDNLPYYMGSVCGYIHQTAEKYTMVFGHATIKPDVLTRRHASLCGRLSKVHTHSS